MRAVAASALDRGRRILREVRKRNVGDQAAACTYYGFMSLPALLLVTIGVFSWAAGKDSVDRIVGRVDEVAPDDVVSLLQRILDNVTATGGSLWLVVVGALVALWSASGAMAALVRGINAAQHEDDTRGFVRKRLAAFAMLALVTVAITLVAGLLLAGPWLARALGDAVDARRTVELAWAATQWPILLVVLTAIATGILTLGATGRPAPLRVTARGAGVAVAGWLLVSAAISTYLTRGGAYDRAWGPLAAVAVTLLWLWLSAYILLIGAVIADLEAERAARSESLDDRANAGEVSVKMG